MTPLEKIKQGIKDGNMELVCNGYNTMTGEKTKANKGNFRTVVSVSDLVSELENILEMCKDMLNGPIDCIDTPVAPKKKRGRPKGKKNASTKKNALAKRKDVLKVEVDGENIDIIEEEAKITNVLGGKKMTFVGSDFNEQDHKDSLTIESMNNGNKRAVAKVHNCELCNKNEGFLVTSNDKSSYICNDCMLARKRK